jgi:hypothetical protein
MEKHERLQLICFLWRSIGAFFKFPTWRENRKGAAPICCCEEKAEDQEKAGGGFGRRGRER